jgi:hypothetical protein
VCVPSSLFFGQSWSLGTALQVNHSAHLLGPITGGAGLIPNGLSKSGAPHNKRQIGVKSWH